MKIFSVFEKKMEIENFNQKLTDAVVISLVVMVVPLIAYINIFSGMASMYSTVSIAANYFLLILLVGVSIFFNKISYKIKRTLVFTVLFFYGINAFILGNLEFMTSIVVILISFAQLTSPRKLANGITIFGLSLYIAYPILYKFNIVSFYYDSTLFHSELSVIIIRVSEAFLGLLFMTVLIVVVFANNNKNIKLLEKKVGEANLLNESLKREMAEKEAAQSLAIEHAHNYLTLFNNSYDGYLLLTDECIIQDVNQAIQQMSGYDRDEMIGTNCIFFLGEEYKEAIEERMQLLKQGRDITDLIANVKSKDGSRVVIQVQLVYIQGAFEYSFLAVTRDITEQHIATEELSKNEELYRTLFEQTNDSILIMNGTKIVEYNNVAKKLYADRNEHEVVLPPYVNPTQEFDEVNDAVRLPQVIEMALGGIAQAFEWVHVYGDDEQPKYTLVNLQDLRRLGKNYYMVVEKDITARKMNNNLILNSIISTEENERKRISSDLHDGIGPLLTTIKLYTEGLVDTKDVNKQELIKSKLVNLVEEAVNSISEISFNISPHILLNHGIVAAVDSFIEKFSIQQKVNITFKHTDITRFSENKEITIYRLFTELINNTLKHAQATEVTFKIFENEHDIILHYTDNGVGFDFEKVRLSRKGMGLGNLKSRIESFNGLFVMKSKEGSGVIVNIKIPKQDI